MRGFFQGPTHAASAASVQHVVSAPDGLVAISAGTGAKQRLFNQDAIALAGHINRSTIASWTSATAPVALQPLIRLGGWTGWHRGMWEPDLRDAARTAGVELKMNVLSERAVPGTTYQLVVHGPKDAVVRMSEWYTRRLDAQHGGTE